MIDQLATRRQLGILAESRRRIAAGVWSPLSLPDIALWISPRDPATITKDGSDRVSQILGLETAAHAFTASGGDQPLYDAAGINGVPAIYFDGTDLLYCAAAGFLGGATWTVSAVVSMPPVISGDRYFLSRSNPRFGYQSSTSGVVFDQYYLVSTAIKRAFARHGHAALAPKILTWVHGSSSDKVYLNGVLQYVADEPSAGIGYLLGSFAAGADAPGDAGCYLGGRAASTALWYGHVGDVVVCDGELSEVDVTLLWAYLQSAYQTPLPRIQTEFTAIGSGNPVTGHAPDLYVHGDLAGVTFGTQPVDAITATADADGRLQEASSTDRHLRTFVELGVQDQLVEVMHIFSATLNSRGFYAIARVNGDPVADGLDGWCVWGRYNVTPGMVLARWAAGSATTRASYSVVPANNQRYNAHVVAKGLSIQGQFTPGISSTLAVTAVDAADAWDDVDHTAAGAAFYLSGTFVTDARILSLFGLEIP